MTIPDTVDALPTIVNVSGGTIACSKAVTTLNVTDGIWTQAAGDITTLTQQNGTVNWNGGNITTATIYGGSFSASGGATARRIGTVNAYPTAILSLDNGQDNITITNYVAHYGGAVVYAPGFKQSAYSTEAYALTADAKLGVSPQIVNNTNVNSDVIYLNASERLDIYCACGSLAANAAMTFKVRESTSAALAGVTDVTGRNVTFADTDDNKTKKLTIWGYELTAGKPWVSVNVANSAAADAYVSAVMVKHTF
jgi:hypothetical protein